MLAKPEKDAQDAQLYEQAVQHFRNKDYVAAAEEFKYLSGLGTAPNADKYYSLSIAGLDCHDGFLGRALGIYEELDLFCDANKLTLALHKFLAPYNGFFKSEDEFLSNFLFIKNGKAAIENGYLFEGNPNYAYDLQFKNNNIYCRYVSPNGDRSKDCLIQFNKTFTAVKMVVSKGAKTGLQGVYHRADYGYEMRQRARR